MADEVKPEVIKKTQEVLGKFIKKPTLTEKLLKKPPFRFLHDICTSVMKETGFFEQVLGPEDKIENVKDKEGKIEFLQKVIAAVEVANSIKLTVKPNKVVAGLEATKTNEFLQALGKALEKQFFHSDVTGFLQQLERISSKTALQTKAKSTNKTEKEIKGESSDKKTSNKFKKVEKNESSESKGKTDLQTPVSQKKKHSNKKLEPSFSGNDDDKIEQEKIKSKNVSNGFTEKEKREETSPKNIAHNDGGSKNFQDVNVVEVNEICGQGDQNFKVEEETVQSAEQKIGNSGKNKHRRPSIYAIPDQNKLTETLENKENLNRKSVVNENGIINEKINLLNKSEFQNQTTPIISSQMNYSKKDTNLVREGTIISRPRTGIRPTTARPASARPAAPRIRDRNDMVVSEEIMKPASGKVQVIADEETANEADDENLISLEIPKDLQETSPILSQNTAASEQEHGHLVEQILEVQKELEDDSQFLEQKESKKIEIEWEAGKSRESTNKEIEKLRANIQNLTRTVNPLGKLLDFFQEDIEIVQKELESWKEKNTSYCLHIAQEKSITDQYVEPLKIHLKELQKNIDDQMEQINIIKANIIRNNEKIHKLLSGL